MARVRKSTSVVVQREIRNVFNSSVTIPKGLVTNEEIRNKFFNYLNKSTVIPNGQLNAIWNLIKRQVVIPVNVKKSGFLEKLFSGMRRKNAVLAEYYDGILGFYSGNSNRIFMLIDNMEKFKYGPDEIACVLVHEFQHMQCHNFPVEFFNLHKKLFTDFYSEMLYEACKLLDPSVDCKVNTNSVALMCKWMIYMFDDLISNPDFGFTSSDMNAYADKIFNSFSNIDRYEKFYNRVMNLLIDAAETILNGKYYDNCKKDSKSPERFSYVTIYKTYKKLNLNPDKLQSFFGQELIYPSEIIALLPYLKMDSNLFAFINRL